MKRVNANITIQAEPTKKLNAHWRKKQNESRIRNERARKSQQKSEACILSRFRHGARKKGSAKRGRERKRNETISKINNNNLDYMSFFSYGLLLCMPCIVRACSSLFSFHLPIEFKRAPAVTRLNVQQQQQKTSAIGSFAWIVTNGVCVQITATTWNIRISLCRQTNILHLTNWHETICFTFLLFRVVSTRCLSCSLCSLLLLPYESQVGMPHWRKANKFDNIAQEPIAHWFCPSVVHLTMEMSHKIQ